MLVVAVLTISVLEQNPSKQGLKRPQPRGWAPGLGSFRAKSIKTRIETNKKATNKKKMAQF